MPRQYLQRRGNNNLKQVPKPTTKNESGESFLAYVLRMKLEEQEIDGEAKLKEIHRKLQEPQQAAPAVNNNNVLLQQVRTAIPHLFTFV